MTASSEASQAKDRFVRVCERIRTAAQQAGRDPAAVALLAVSKLQPAAKVSELYAVGQRAFGENYVQEAVQKCTELADLAGIEWHLIGPLQSNKTRVVAETMHWVHSVDRLKIAERLSAQRPADLPPLNICIQVNISGEASKSGCAPDEAAALAKAASGLPRLRVRGLMGMPEPGIGAEATRSQFALLARLYAEAKQQVAGIDTLSMGMSDDLEIAVASGSTMVRVGTALFGARPVNQQPG
ncbi:YggS family pyridoxal phosphate-dependent enzyme [Casimicrobium huifangae]|uniref:YggS family pyridoxal phosphate-dependent enzyme n=1 Tax=Casimicrobium huifangae TaxID=2591109 RepID=UPI003782F610